MGCRWTIMAVAWGMGVVYGAGEVRLSNGVERCTVRTERYRLQVDVASSTPLVFTGAEDETVLVRFEGLALDADGTRWTSDPEAGRPHLHTLRAGPHLVEFHLEKIIARGGGQVWPGLMELSVYCHPDRVYLVGRCLCPNGAWIHRGTHVYDVPEEHRNGPPVHPRAAMMFLRPAVGWTEQEGALVAAGTLGLGWLATVPDTGGTERHGVRSLQADSEGLTWTLAESTWEPGSQHEFGGVLIFAEDDQSLAAALDVERHPLNPAQFTMQHGQFEGYDPRSGVYRITGQTAPSPEPPRGYVGGSQFTVRNDGRARRLLIDQRDPWGGLCGGVLRDDRGEPIPTLIQFFLNFPELHQEAGEPGLAVLTYPLDLAPGESRSLTAEHLFHGTSDREVIYLTSLENVGEPLLLQTTVSRCEAYTQTTGPYSTAGQTPDNTLRINDFRRLYSQIVERSVSAILPTFFGYYDADGNFQGLIPGEITFRETGPFLTETVTACATPDGAVTGNVRVWEAAHADMVRIFCEVRLTVQRDVSLAARQDRLFFLRHHAFNPMAFMRYAYTAADGQTKWGEMGYEGRVHLNGEPLGPHPLACAYWAQNPLDKGLPCSRITGNPGFVLLEWDVRFGDRAVSPGLYAFSTGANDLEHGAYARDAAIVPTPPAPPYEGGERGGTIPAGSRIYYRCVQMVYGDDQSDYRPMEAERRAWAEAGGLAQRPAPILLTAEVGEVLSHDPPEVRAEAGRAVVTLAGGTDWVPLRLRGLRPGIPLKIMQTDTTGTRELGPGKPGEVWYNAWPDGNGQAGFTVLIRTDPTGEPVRLEVRQRE